MHKMFKCYICTDLGSCSNGGVALEHLHVYDKWQVRGVLYIQDAYVTDVMHMWAQSAYIHLWVAM